jgi:cellobiose phosphorylase
MYFKKMLPNRIDSDLFVAEPYVFSQYITSNEHSSPGRASHSWQTGSASWMFRVSYDYLIGIRPTYQGLLIDPAVPSDWKHFSVERMFRGTRYCIEFENSKGTDTGISQVIVDGTPIEDAIIPISEKEICNVKVILK